MNQVNQSCFKVQMEINKYYLFRNKQLSSNFYPQKTKKTEQLFWAGLGVWPVRPIFGQESSGYKRINCGAHKIWRK